MAQKPYQEDGEKPEDYEFREEHEDIDYEYQDEGSGGKRRFKWRRLLIFIIIVLAVLWFFYHQYEHKRASQEAQAEEHAATTAPKISSQPTVPTQQTVKQQKTQPVVQQSRPSHAESRQAKEAAAAMTRGISENRRELSQLRTEVARVENRVNVLVPEAQQNSSRLTQMNQSMQSNQDEVTQQLKSINQELSKVSVELGTIESARKAEEMAHLTAQARREAAIRHRIQYYVQAVIPGRAWLKGVNGSTITVAVGDIIDGYGKILAIDPYSGDVVTSSGVIIKYGLR